MDSHVMSNCPNAPATTGRRAAHTINPRTVYLEGRGWARWTRCASCLRTLWGLETIHEELEPW